MCGRYAMWGINLAGGRFLIIDPTLGFRSHFNIAPGSENLVITGSPEGNRAVAMQWGLVPHWSKDPSPAHRPINARAESLSEKPMFRGLLGHNRCVVPANGFYEWKKAGGSREPYFICRRDRDLFGFAGLYDTWQGPDGAVRVTYTIITTEANELVRPIHNRMPVILPRDQENRWLSHDKPGADELETLLSPYAADDMIAYAVSRKVNATATDGEDLIRPLPEQKSWFG